LAYIARCNQYVPKSGFVGFLGCISDVFYIGERLCVSICDAWTMVLKAKCNHLIRLQLVVVNILWRNLRYFVILTVQTSEIATCTCNGEACGAWMKMVKRLLLNWIDGQRARLGIHLADENTILIASTATDARFTITYLTVMWTKVAFHSSILQLIIISALHQKTIAS
jgi:hypothetical protein